VNRAGDWFEDHHGDLAVGALLVVGEARISLLLALPDLLALGGARDTCGDLLDVVADLDARFGMGEQVVEPVGVGWRAALRREHRVGVADSLVHHRVDAFLAAAGAGRVKQQERRSLEVAANAPGVGTELLDDRRVPVRSVGHRGLLHSGIRATTPETSAIIPAERRPGS
jgi:hypothetical protein